MVSVKHGRIGEQSIPIGGFCLDRGRHRVKRHLHDGVCTEWACLRNSGERRELLMTSDPYMLKLPVISLLKARR